MAQKESILTIIMFLIGGVFIVESLHLGLGNIHRPGAGFLPFFTGLGLSVAAIVSLLRSCFRADADKGGERKGLLGRSRFNVISIVVALVIYALTFEQLGYLLSTFLLLIFLFKAGGFQRWAFALVASLLTISLSYLLFSIWLNIRFPKGFLGF